MAYFVRRDFFKSLTIAAAFGAATFVAYILEHEVTLYRGVILAIGSILLWLALVTVGRTLGWLVYIGKRDRADLNLTYERFLSDTSVGRSKSAR